METKKHITYFFLMVIWVAMVVSCVEEFDAEVQDFESILVVDARLTDRAEVQAINLSRTFEFDSIPVPERNATVSLVGEGGTSYAFTEDAPGTYTSTSILQLSQGEGYQLRISTSNGLEFVSNVEELPEQVEIAGVRAIRRTNGNGVEGVAIVMDNGPATSEPEFFRYEFEETYKIIAPDYNPSEWGEIDYDINDGDGWSVDLKPRTEEARICYGTNSSRDLILASTQALNGSGLKDFEVRFLGRDNYFISNRYSILVRQYHHTLGANAFYATLQDFSSVETVFSAVQPGFLEGNMNSTTPGARVLGYFEFSSYSEERIFFDYTDLFPNEPLPPYLMNCATGAPSLYPEGFHFTPAPNGDGFVIDGNGNSPLLDGILAGVYAYHADNENYEEWLQTEGFAGAAPYLVKPKGCGDCRVFGSNVEPEFWMEE